MKKYLVASTALLSALIAMPAQAELNLDLGGYFRAYGMYADNDDSVAPGTSTNDFDLKRDTEIHFTGEATSDNGLTVGAHYEAMVGGAFNADEAYLYVAHQWGRFNLGSEDGAAYLLQVAAPSADSNVDGLRTQIQGINAAAGTALAPTAAVTTVGAILGAGSGYTGAFTNEFSTGVAATGTASILDYDHADFQDTERLTYLTPKWNGFQGGVSYAPEAGQNIVGDNLAAPAVAPAIEDLWEAAARWDGEYEGFGISFGAGYSTADGTSAVATDADEITTWNAGLNVAFQGFSVGAAYLDSEVELVGGGDDEADTWVVGAAWDNGPYHIGASYLDKEVDTAAAASASVDRLTVGAGYTYGPGMSFRGAVAFGENELVAGGGDDFTQVTIGTDIQF